MDQRIQAQIDRLQRDAAAHGKEFIPMPEFIDTLTLAWAILDNVRALADDVAALNTQERNNEKSH